MKFLRSIHFAAALLFVVVSSAMARAQSTLGYRQVNLTCNVPCTGAQQSDFLVSPWGIAFLPDQNFLIAENQSGRVDSYDAAGQLVSGLSLPLPAGSLAVTSRPTGIVADPQSNFFIGQTHFQFLVATEEGTVIGFNQSNGQFTGAQIVIDKSSSDAVYTGMTLLHPSCCNPKLAVANFHSGEIEVYGLSPTALPGAFQDPSLPTGYAPYNVQVISDKVYVVYALQDESRRAPAIGEGLGIVSIFDQDGNFVRRFVSDGGRLDIPWGITVSSASFGPFPGDILIGNVGNTRINIFDPVTGAYLGPLVNSEQKLVLNPVVRALTFRNDSLGDPSSLYFVASPQANGVLGGLFGSVRVGQLTRTQLFGSDTVAGEEANLVAQVNSLAGNAVTGKVIFSDDGVSLGEDSVVGGLAAVFPIFSRVGTHTIAAEYQGTDALLPSIAQIQINVLGPATTTTLTAQATAGLGTPVTFRARTLSPDAIVTGNVTFSEGSTVLGIVPLDEHDTATLVITTLGLGDHSVTATYSGASFQNSTSAPVHVFIGGDFQFTSTSQALTVMSGNSAGETLTVTPNGGFVGPVTFNCLAPSGITCSFNPPTLNLASVPVTTALTINAVTVAARNSHGILFSTLAVGLFGAMFMQRRVRSAKFPLALIAGFATVLFMASCGGAQKQIVPPSTTTSTVTVNATSGSVSHFINISVTVQR